MELEQQKLIEDKLYLYEQRRTRAEKENSEQAILEDKIFKLREEINACNKDNKELVNSASEDSLTIQSLQNSNDELTNELALLSADLSSAQIELVNRNAKEAQRLAELNKTKKQQVRAIRESPVVAQTAAIKPGFYEQAAKNLQNFTTDANPVSIPRETGGRGRQNFQKERDDGFDLF